MKRFLNISLLILIFAAGCEKEITLDLPEPEDKIVVEGAIEQGQYPYVVITRNTGYFEPVDSAAIMDLVVTDAVITVSDGNITDTLQPVIDLFHLPFLKYQGSKIIGESGKTYSLMIQAEGEIYTAQTTIPNPVQLDSIKPKFEETAANGDSLYILWFYFKDPDSLGNYYRIFSKTIGKDFIFVRPFGSVADDKIINGKPVEFSIYRGRDPLRDSEYDDEGLDENGIPRWAYLKGESVIMKFTTIDYIHYDFWYSIEQQMMTDANPFASPVSARTNISGDALGIWGGYGVFLDTVKIK